MVVAVALVRKYTQSSAGHALLVGIFSNWRQQLATGDLEWPDVTSRMAIESSLETERGGMAERFKAPVLKTGDP
jgi:hypothetical protein